MSLLKLGKTNLIWFGFALFVPAGTLTALSQQEAKVDKAGYSLFRPTPRDLMRDLAADRPDITESPYTVDAGHFQVEMDFLRATFDRDQSAGGDLRSSVWEFGSINLKVGLLNRVDLQTVLEPQIRSRREDRLTSTLDKASGFGDVQTRLKVNLWGNDSGRTSLGIMPFVKWPLSSSGLRNGKTEGGLVVPLAVDLGHSWSLGIMTEVDFVADGGGGHDTEWLNTLTVGRNLTSKLGMYVEWTALTGSAPGFRWQGGMGVGWTYALGKDVQLDLGCNFGVTDPAADFQPFTGMTFRF